MASRRPLVIVSGLLSELPAGDTVLGTNAGTLAAGSGLSGGGALTGSTVTLDVSLATNASGLIFVGDALGIDGVVQTVASAAQASGNAALIVGTTALSSGNFAQSTGTTALASGNAALTSAALKLPLIGGTLTGDLTINAQNDLRLADADSSNYVAIQAASVISSNVTFTAPSADGTNGQVLTTNGSGVLSFSTPSGGTILYNRRPALHRGPLFSKTAATTISVAAGAVLNGQYYASATAVTMGTHTNNTDMAIWQHPTTGALVSDASYTTAPAGATGGSIVGGYHYIPSGRPTAFDNGSPTTAAEILEYSIWDLTWRPVCPDPRGMTCVDGRFWCDLYFCGSTSYATTAFSAVPSSKIGLTIADQSSPAKIPSFYGGNGSTSYSESGSGGTALRTNSWYNFAEVAHSFGKRYMFSWEFQAAAFGAPEASSRGSDPGTVIWERQSKWGLAQATGTQMVWGIERTGSAGSTTNTSTGGRGTETVDTTTGRAVVLGGDYGHGALSGSRFASWELKVYEGGNTIGYFPAARFACEHLVLS